MTQLPQSAKLWADLCAAKRWHTGSFGIHHNWKTVAQLFDWACRKEPHLIDQMIKQEWACGFLQSHPLLLRCAAQHHPKILPLLIQKLPPSVWEDVVRGLGQDISTESTHPNTQDPLDCLVNKRRNRAKLCLDNITTGGFPSQALKPPNAR